jgi:hypothetical protein
MNIIRIQSTWRSFRCRKKIKFYSRLPDDLWNIIRKFYFDDTYGVIDRILYIKIVRLYWTPPHMLLQQKMNCLRLIRKYLLCLKLHTKQRAVELCTRLHNDLYNFKIYSLLINATLELLH